MRLVGKALYFSNKECVLLTATGVTIDTLGDIYDKSYIKCHNVYDLAWEAAELDATAKDEKFKLVYNIMACNVIGSILAYTIMSGLPIPKIDLESIASFICVSDCFPTLKNFCDEVYFSEEYIKSALNLPIPGKVRVNECNHDWLVPLVYGELFYEYIAVQALRLGLLNESLRLILTTKYFKMKKEEYN